MRLRRAVALLLLASSGPAIAADQLSFGPAPSWVIPMAIPQTSNAPVEAPAAILLSDQQVRLEPGTTTTYVETALKIQNGEGLGAGNLSLPWDPATDKVTIHKLLILRDGQTIDVLKSGQTFTTMRREQNLDTAMLDGRLTANIQPEGLQQGDILVLATSVEHRDPVLKDHVQSQFAMWNAIPIQAARARVVWPNEVKLKVQQTNLPAVKPTRRGSENQLEIALTDVQPLLFPRGAPLRYSVGRYAEASDFSSWAEVADLIAPYYEAASKIPASGPLRDEVETLRKVTDKRSQVEQALALVQDRVRYVALLMGEGGYVPAPAESTWNRRFGDCKGKTTLLLGILYELGVKADAVLVNSSAGDLISGRLPMLSVFDHVLVRAELEGKTYWLDGTRSGDASLDAIEVPEFSWGLPIAPASKLVAITPPPLSVPDTEVAVSIDASQGVFAPAPFKVERILRGDAARIINTTFSKLSPAQLDEMQKNLWKKSYDYVTPKESTFTFDKKKAELRLTMTGEAKLEWDDGWFDVPNSNIAYEPDFERTSGINRDAPFALAYPNYEVSHVEIRLPRGFSPTQPKVPAAVHETLAGVEYSRTIKLEGGKLTLDRSERTIVPEISYQDAQAAAARLKALAGEDVYLRVPEGYRATENDLQSKSKEKPSSASAFVSRGLIFMDKKKYDQALADFSEANKLDPKDAWALANRGLVYVWKQDFAAAERDLAAAEAIQPDNMVMRRARGLMAELKGNLTAALSIYDKILLRNSDDSMVRLRRAAILMQQGKRDDALADLDAAIAGDPRNPEALAQRAQVWASKEDWVAADKDLTAASALDSENATVLATKAMIAMQRKDYKSALDLATKALTREPENDYARYLQGQLLKREGGEKAAMQTYDEAVIRDPTDPTALLMRAFANIEEKNFEEAEKDIDAVAKLAPAEPRAMIARGYLASARGDRKGAIKAYTAALATAPNNGPVLFNRAEAYRQSGEFDLAFADTEAALKAGLVSPELRLQRINILIAKGDLAGVDTEAGLLTTENPTSEFALVVAGKSYAAIGERKKALATIDRALAINAVPYIYINRADIRPESDRDAKIADLDAALKLDPEYEDALAAKAYLLSKSGKHSEAIELYDRAIKLAFDGRYLELSRAVALERAGKQEEAKKAFDAVSARAKTADDFKRQCWTKAINDVELRSALDDCDTALRLDPDSRGASESRGMALLKLGKDRDAIAAYDKAVAIKTGADAYMGRAIARARLGDESGAQADALQARKLRPDIDDTFEQYGLNTAAELAHH